MDCGPPGPSVQGILQARILEKVATPSSQGSSPPRDGTPVSCIASRFFTIWAIGKSLIIVIALQCCISFCCTTMRISYIRVCACIYTSLYPLPPTLPISPLYLITAHWAELPVLRRSFPLAGCFTHGSVFTSLPCSQSIPPSPSPSGVHKSVLCVCVSVPALPIGPSVPFFWIPYICINIWYLFFSFWLTSLCMTDKTTILKRKKWEEGN